MQRNRPHIPSVDAVADVPLMEIKPAKRRGSYNCGRCGLPKKGHTCHLAPAANSTSTSNSNSTSTPTPSVAITTDSFSSSAARPPHPPPPRQQSSHLRRALSFDDIDVRSNSPEPEMNFYDISLGSDLDSDAMVRSGGLPSACLWEVLRRLPPAGLLASAMVCKGWRETAKRLWRAAEELRLRVPPRAPLGFVGSILQKCPTLVRLSLRMDRCMSNLGQIYSFIAWIGLYRWRFRKMINLYNDKITETN